MKQQHQNGHQNGTVTDHNEDDPTRPGLTKDSSDKTGALSSNLGLSNIMGGSLFSDDASFEEQYNSEAGNGGIIGVEQHQQQHQEEVSIEIIAPAGKLGMVIDTPNGGFPIVHAIKDTSVLADKIVVGDRLVSVDGQDCTSMTAVQVSKLISLKSEQPSRVLVFVRRGPTTNLNGRVR